MDVVARARRGPAVRHLHGTGIERYIREVLSDPDRSDDFRAIDHELYLVATDLDTCERIVFGADGWDDVPISRAVRASTALPMVFKPVHVNDRELIDGGIISTTNVDIAVEAGAKLVVVVNPLVPYVNDFSTDIATPFGSRVRRVSDMGFAQIGYQTFKLLAYQRLHEMARHWEQKYPDVDILLIEPEPDDELMFQTSIMDFTKRIEIARHGFESVTLRLAEDYETYKEVLGRHGIEISATRVRKVVKHVTREKEKTRAWRRILEQTTDDAPAPVGVRETTTARPQRRAKKPRASAPALARRLRASARSSARRSGPSLAVLDRRADVPRVAERAAGPDDDA